MSCSSKNNSTKYPCGTCDITVTWKDRGVACESCGMWFHAACQSIGSASYSNLNDSNISWKCIICDNPNYSNISFDLFGIETEIVSQISPSKTTESIDISLDPISPISRSSNFIPNHASTPSTASKPNKQNYRPLRLVNINFRSARGKKPDIINMIESVQPDVIIGTETHLDKNIPDSEFLPPNYKAHRKDRNKDGGGVLIALKGDLFMNSTRVPELETDCEILWVKLKINDSTDHHICAYYRPHTGDIVSFSNFETSIMKASSRGNPKLVIAGDLNFPDCNWSDLTVKPSNYPNLHKKLYELLHDTGIDQLVKEPTRELNTLDLVMTNMPHLIPRLETIPGLSDHDIVYFEYVTDLKIGTQTPRSVSIYKKANWPAMKQTFIQESLELQKQFSLNCTAEDMWQHFKSTYDNTVKLNIPTKNLKEKISHPWITLEIKKLMKKRDKKFRLFKKCRCELLKEEIRKLKREIRRKTRRSHWDFINQLFVKKDGEEGGQHLKRFWSYAKKQRKTNFGVPPLKVNGKLISDAKGKAEILNKQFDQAFSEGKVYDSESIKEKCSLDAKEYPSMPNITFTVEGIFKLLKGLNPSKAPGTDGITPRVLKELAFEIAPPLH